MEQREKDIQELCKQVLNASANVYYNQNGGDDVTCPLCFCVSGGNCSDMADIRHEPHCAYLIAKDLSTNLI